MTFLKSLFDRVNSFMPADVTPEFDINSTTGVIGRFWWVNSGIANDTNLVQWGSFSWGKSMQIVIERHVKD